MPVMKRFPVFASCVKKAKVRGRCLRRTSLRRWHRNR